MPAPDGLHQLVENFERNRDAYHSGNYNETQVRVDFINPLFEFLGWDVTNQQGNSPAYQDVVHEDAIKVGGAHKAPDYGFRVGGARKFFVEAKKPSVSIEDNPLPAFQLRRYGWSARLPLSILTDFEEFAVYDCRIQPDKSDSSVVARERFHRYDEYVDKWDEIAATFSRQAVLDGSFDASAQTAATRRGKATVDAVFLKEIETWREMLARDLALHNPELTRRDLNYAVQMTIDRVVFLRMTEDRGIEEYGRLQALLNGGHVYERLRELYRQADERYNSGLFHFHTERGRDEAPDELTSQLSIEDASLKSIIKSLYYPDSPYEFSVLPIEVLGQVYEQFLGRVIDISHDRQVTIEEKPEVRKAGGVYYTPKYIVDYIVENTVGALVKGKKPGPRGAVSELRIVDPACGSGSFLIGAYEYLLDWHRDRYIADGPQKHRKELFQGMGRQWLLTTAEKKRILLNNIYGVDIDPQAVEVTKLSLLLKVLEGETSESIVSQLTLFRERALPDLSDNIKCGNSLIGPDFYDNQQMSFLDTEEHYRINVFDWKAAFPEVFGGTNSGFDAVIGNPPYLSYSGRQAIEVSESVRRYLFGTYEARGWPTSHSFFIEKSVRSLSKRLVSFIVPDQVGHLDGYKPTRKVITKYSDLVEVRYWGERVFENVVTPALTFVADATYTGGTSVCPVEGPIAVGVLEGGAEWNVSVDGDLLRKFFANSESLGTLVADPGVHTGNVSKTLILPTSQATSDAVPVLEGKQVSRYACEKPNKLVRLEYKPKDSEYFTIRHEKRYRDAAFLIRQTAAFPIVGPRHHSVYFRNSLLALYSPDDRRSVLYLVGLLNSSLMRFAYSRIVRESSQKAFPQVKIRSLRALPIRRIDFSNESDCALHDRMVSLIDQMLSLHERIGESRTDHDQTILQRQIEATDRQIDRLVYELYGLTEDEIAVIEGSVARER